MRYTNSFVIDYIIVLLYMPHILLFYAKLTNQKHFVLFLPLSWWQIIYEYIGKLEITLHFRKYEGRFFFFC